MKKITLLILIISLPFLAAGQQLYNNFEDTHPMWFGFHNGALDTTAANPAPNAINNSAVCGKYIRDTTLYDVMMFYPLSKMEDVSISGYSSNAFGAPKMKMKVYTSSPVGTPISLQLGIKSDNSYPGGVHSEYQTVTTAQNAWHTVTFNFIQMGGAMGSSADIDKVVVLFNPGFNTTDTVYFDDLLLPPQVIPGIPAHTSPAIKLFQNTPNPAKERTQISFQVSTGGETSIRLMDVLGNPVAVLFDQELRPGSYTIPVETSSLPDGIYFYVLKMNGMTRTMKMIVAK